MLLLGLGIVVLSAGVAGLLGIALREPAVRPDRTVAARREEEPASRLTVRYPLDGTLFPPEIAAPTFRWEDTQEGSDTWVLSIEAADGEDPMQFRTGTTEWTPSESDWEAIKRRSVQKAAHVTIVGVHHAAPEKVLSRGSVSIRVSEDEVGAPLFYREVNLPFREAVQDPAAHIRWRFGAVSSQQRPPAVLERLPVCGNCHSFSADGALLGMDVDYANEKGSYAMTPVGAEMKLDDEKIITWNDYRREDGEHTFGMLSQVSPDGRYVMSTVKDRSVFVPRDDLAFSQLFFPVKGILVFYDRRTKQFHPLPGADDRQFVQGNPTWSPDGKEIVFARQKAHPLKELDDAGSVLLSPEQCREFLDGGETFLFDLYRIPFNEGRGGEPEPVEGASHNGMSNYFPKYSPDGKWIVFCRAKSFMLLQPDSELYITPAQGGEARRLACNTQRMNSWHSWSPNGKWLVFASKANSPFTQLFLTHVDQRGESSPAVLLDRFTAPDRAANIPEFVNVPPGAIQKIDVAFLNDRSYFRAGFRKMMGRDFAGAEEAFRKTLQLNPQYVAAHFNLAVILLETGRRAEAIDHCRQALEVDPECFEAHLNLGRALQDAGELDEATHHLSEAVRLRPDNAPARYHLGLAMQSQGQEGQAVVHYQRAIEERPDQLPPLLALASIRATSRYYELRDAEEAIRLAARACQLTRYQDPAALDVLASAYAAAGRFPEAVQWGQLALEIAAAAGDAELAKTAARRLDLYRQQKPVE